MHLVALAIGNPPLDRWLLTLLDCPDQSDNDDSIAQGPSERFQFGGGIGAAFLLKVAVFGLFGVGPGVVLRVRTAEGDEQVEPTGEGAFFVLADLNVVVVGFKVIHDSALARARVVRREHHGAAAGFQPRHPRVLVGIARGGDRDVRLRVGAFRIHLSCADEFHGLRPGQLLRSG